MTTSPLCVVLALLALAAPVGAAEAPYALTADDHAFLDDVQHRTFDFFWKTPPAETGLTPDRWPSASPCSIAAVGMGLAAYCVGVERGWVDRAAAAERTVKTLRFFHDAPQHDGADAVTGHRGFYYHFIELKSGHRWRKCELSSMDTALLMMGVLAAREYYDGDTPAESEVRELADALYRRVEWDWFQPRAPLVAMGWRPEDRANEPRGFGIADYRGYDEAMSLYVLAIGSPTHPIDPAGWEAFCETYTWAEFYGPAHVNFAPLFGHQHPACWIDSRGLKDRYLRAKGIDYFENSRRATLSQRAYATANPGGWRDYGGDLWGLTPCDGPAGIEREEGGVTRSYFTYRARGASAEEIVDDGTLAPTAVGSSLPFAPAETLAALRAMKARYGDRLYGEYGYRNAFNPTFRYADAEVERGVVDPELGWFDSDYLGLDQGPILLAAENLRSGFVWRLMAKSPYLRAGLERAGFSAGLAQSRGDAEESKIPITKSQ